MTDNNAAIQTDQLPTGPKPGDRNTTFLEDPVADHLLRAIVTLTMELSVSRDRIKTLETLLVESGALQDGAADAHKPDGQDAIGRNADRNALIASILDPIMQHMAQSK